MKEELSEIIVDSKKHLDKWAVIGEDGRILESNSNIGELLKLSENKYKNEDITIMYIFDPKKSYYYENT